MMEEPYTAGEQVVTEADLNDNFANYASNRGVSMMNLSENISNTVNVVGMVFDMSNDIPITNATIHINGSNIHVDENGRFQIPNMPDGKYDWVISADGYETAEYLNYEIDVAGGTNIFTFYLSKDEQIQKDRDIEMSQERCENSSEVANLNSNIIDTQAMSTVLTVSSTVKVYYNGAIREVSRKEYVRGVVAGEAYSADWYAERGLSTAQIRQYYCVQAEAANTLAVYFQKVETSKHSRYDVCAQTHCQHYDPVQTTAEIIAAADLIFYSTGVCQVLMYEPSAGSYNYMCPFYFSSCGGNGTITYGSSAPYIRAKSCSDLTSGAGGHRWGMCQMGAAKKAKNGSACEDILTYYYSDCDTEFCRMV